MRSLLICCIAAAASALAACSQTPADAGYVDGCRSGYLQAGRDGFQYNADFRLDPALYAQSAEYRQAWDAARRACIEEQRLAPRMMPGPHG